MLQRIIEDLLSTSWCTHKRLQFLLNSDFLQTRDSADKLTSAISPEDTAVLKLHFYL